MKRVALLLCLSPFALAQDIDLPHTLSNSSVADADQVMANFNALKDGVNSRVSVDLTNDNVVLGNGLLLNSPDPDYFVWSGQSNVAIGFDALLSNTRGYENTAVGVHALRANTDGRLNTAIGLQALENHTADSNTALGRGAMRFTTLGSGNTALGDAALRGQPGTGSTADMTGNTAVGAFALGDIYSGQRNTASGTQALFSNTTGSGNTAIGYMADVTSGNLQNATAIGNNAKVDASNKIQLGNTDVTSVATSGKLTTGTVTYPNAHGTNGEVLGTTGSGELVWVGTDDIIAQHTQELEEQVASLQEQLKSQQEELLAIVQSQQEQIAQLQRMVEHQFVAR